MASLLLAACGSAEQDRQFAGDPVDRPTITAVTDGPAAEPATPVAANQPAASPIPLDELLGPGDGPEQVFLPNGTGLVVVHPGTGTARPLVIPGDAVLAAYAPAPDGASVALLISGRNGWSVVVLDEAGLEQARWDNLGGSAASPSALDSRAGMGGLAWNPAGDRLVLALPTGGLFELEPGASPLRILAPARAGAPGGVAWSPTGEALAYAAPTDGRTNSAISVGSSGAYPLDPVPVLPATEAGSRTVLQLAWGAGNRLCALIGIRGGALPGGDLFAIPVSGGVPSLVANAAAVSPAASITGFALSPSGDAVAWIVSTPTAVGGAESVVAVRQLDGGAPFRIDLPRRSRVTGLAWSAEGLVLALATTTADGTAAGYALVAPDGEAHLLQPPAAGSPVPVTGSPVATP